MEDLHDGQTLVLDLEIPAGIMLSQSLAMEVNMQNLGEKYVSFEEGFDFVIEATEDLQGGHALVSDLEIFACTIAHKDINMCLKVGVQERFRVRDVTLENLRARMQIPPPGPFDKTDISWEEKINQGRGRSRNTCTTIIPWDKLQDFVVGEQVCEIFHAHSMRFTNQGTRDQRPKSKVPSSSFRESSEIYFVVISMVWKHH